MIGNNGKVETRSAWSKEGFFEEIMFKMRMGGLWLIWKVLRTMRSTKGAKPMLNEIDNW